MKKLLLFSDLHSFQERLVQVSFAEGLRIVYVHSEANKLVADTLTTLCSHQTNHGDNCSHNVPCTLEGSTAEQNIHVVTGPRGCGKSTLVANWMEAFNSKGRNTEILLHFVETSPDSADITSWMKTCIHKLRGLQILKYKTWPDLKNSIQCTIH